MNSAASSAVGPGRGIGRVLFTLHAPSAANAGAGAVMDAVMAECRAQGIDVELLSFDVFGTRLGVVLRSLLFPWVVAWTLERRVRQGNVDVVDASSGDAWLWARWLRRRRTRPVLVCRSHGLEHTHHRQMLMASRAGTHPLRWRYFLYWGGWRLREVGSSLRSADAVLVLNSSDASYADEVIGVRPSRIHRLPNGLSAPFLNRPVPTAEPMRGTCIRLAMVGSFIARKGINTAIPALVDLLGPDDRLELSLVGTGVPAREVLSSFPANMHDRIHVRERYDHDELPRLLADHQVGIFPTLFEGFGLGLLEMMACGLACVSSAVPGPRDIVTDGEDGLLVPPGDVPALHAALLRVTRDSALRDRLRAGAHNTAQHYSWPEIVQQTLAVYREASIRPNTG